MSIKAKMEDPKIRLTSNLLNWSFAGLCIASIIHLDTSASKSESVEEMVANPSHFNSETALQTSPSRHSAVIHVASSGNKRSVLNHARKLSERENKSGWVLLGYDFMDHPLSRENSNRIENKICLL